ncbi:NYN domain-containing protein [Peteryoungia ipomoeae]|uniref:NYN domain-containing protein n=1 Tax=Peteryoungia ipomoeae TaxID=1210932 RepID=A0A4S8PBJ6_9HYPH|nr:NYN domain-containing protein [Peteryoungia ipomoeae]THV25574.1 NYN domain-containing protein [Peteryoungia ipomoeae]
MAVNHRPPRLAVLIDADNTSSKIMDGLFEEVARLGEASVRRIYGDFSSPHTKGWSEILMRHAIAPHQQFAYTVGKNSTDIALVIDAMDLLWSGRFDGFCLVSSDGDFARLATRLREQGVDVFGFGREKSSEAFRQACRKFIFTESLVREAAATSKPRACSPPVKTVAPPPAATDAIPVLEKMLSCMKSDGGWVSLAELGTQLSQAQPKFDPRAYGSSKLSGLVKKTGAFDIKQAGQAVHVKSKKI